MTDQMISPHLHLQSPFLLVTAAAAPAIPSKRRCASPHRTAAPHLRRTCAAPLRPAPWVRHRQRTVTQLVLID
jgi:hypothetical protein